MTDNNAADNAIRAALGLPPVGRNLPLECFVQVESEVRGVLEGELRQVTVDVPSAVATMLGAVELLKPLRPLFGQLPFYNIERHDKLHVYAYATSHCHGIMPLAEVPVEMMPELRDAGIRLYDVLYASARAIGSYGLANVDFLNTLDGKNGARNLSVALTTLANFHLEHKLVIAGKTPVTDNDVELASAIGGELLKAKGVKETSPAVTADASLLRQQAFTLAFTTYQQARRGTLFIRFDEGDAENFTPTLHANRANVRRKEPGADTEEGADSELAPAVPVTGAAATPAPARAAPARANSGFAFPEPPPGGWAPEGLPGSNPFRR